MPKHTRRLQWQSRMQDIANNAREDFCFAPASLEIQCTRDYTSVSVEVFCGASSRSWFTNKCIADAWDGENVGRITGIRLHLLAYVANMCLDQTCIAIVAEPPDVRNNLAGRTDMIRIDRQQMQELTLYRCKAGLSPIHEDLVMQRIDTNGANGDDGRRTLREGGTPSPAQGMDVR